MSSSLQKWLTARAATLDTLETAHRSIRGTGPGARAATQQINQAYALLLSAQFQGFCRDFHTECADSFVDPLTDPTYQRVVLDSLILNRKLDRGNPNSGNIGADFSRFKIALWALVDAHRSPNAARRATLEDLNEWRNAIAHQDFAPTMLTAGHPHLTLGQVQKWRKACDGLAHSFDEVLRVYLQGLIGTAPW